MDSSRTKRSSAEATQQSATTNMTNTEAPSKMAKPSALNISIAPLKGKSASEMSLELQKTMLKLSGQFFAPDGSGVDYRKLGESDEFKEYKRLTGGLKTVKLADLEDKERSCFCINVYNALVIHGIVDSIMNDHNSVLDQKGFFRNTCYVIGDETFSLDDLEHGVLRANRPHPSGWIAFEEGDPRTKAAVKDLDPRIHFALVCGAKSCPAIRVFRPTNLDKALSGAASSFLNQEVEIDLEKKEVTLSKLLSWYGGDFSDTDAGRLKWIRQYLKDDLAEKMGTLLAGEEKEIIVKYRDYNWSLNIK